VTSIPYLPSEEDTFFIKNIKIYYTNKYKSMRVGVTTPHSLGVTSFHCNKLVHSDSFKIKVDKLKDKGRGGG